MSEHPTVGSRAAAALRARQLAELLRARRSALAPADVGLVAGPRRRTPGLRREEVAQLAGISTTYYTYLEQGRNLRPSPEVLDDLAGALRLGPLDRARLHGLAHPAPDDRGRQPGREPAESLPAALAQLVDRLDPQPTYVTGRYWDVLAANRAARLLWADWPALPAAERNLLWWTLTDPRARRVLVDWPAEASAQLARFRAAATAAPDDPGYAELADRLLAASAEARRWWPELRLAPLSSGVKRIAHEELGEIEFRHTVLQLADDPRQKLVTFAAAAQDECRIAALLERRPG